MAAPFAQTAPEVISIEVKDVADKLVELLAADGATFEATVCAMMFVACLSSHETSGRITFMHSLVLELANRATVANLTPELQRERAMLDMALKASKAALEELRAELIGSAA